MTPPDTLELPVAELSDAKRALLAARLRGLHRAQSIPVRDGDGPAPLSFAQERLWFLERVGQGGTAYNIPAGVRLRGGVDEAALERALGEMVRRHASLRTTFGETDGVPAQVAAPFGFFVLPIDDLTALDEASREAEVRRRAADEAALPFDLERGPPFRARLLRLAGDEQVLLLCMHHIVGDGWSTRVLFRELWALYAAVRDGRPSPLDAPALQYADYAAWQRSRAGGAQEARDLAYWTERLAGAPELLELPADHPRPATPSFRGAAVPLRVPADVLAGLRDVARDGGATLYMVVLAAFQLVLARWAGTDDVVVGAPVAGRTRRETHDLIGLFVNTLVLRTRLDGDPTFRELVGRVRETVLGAYEHQELPFERLVAALAPERTLARSALFQVMFMLDDAGAAPARGASALPGLETGEVEPERGTTKFDLTLGLDAGPDGMAGVLDYSLDLFEPATAHRLVTHLLRVLSQAAADPDRPVSAVELMDADEAAWLDAWNRTAAPYPHDRCIHQLFEAQAARTPDAVAVVHEDGTLTFAELDARANRLARHLRGLGIGPERKVGLCLERGLELLPAILGVMKAGGAWVPVDPAHPAERIGYVLDDAGVSVLLTQARLVDRAPVSAEVRVVCVDREASVIAAQDAAPVNGGATAENLAYVIYTSGSTGRPKGVAMHHRGVCNYIHWGIEAYGAAAGAGAPVFSSMAVDLTLTNLLPLFAGHPVRLLGEDSPVEQLAAALRERPGFGMIKITPVHLSLLTPLLTPDEARDAARTLVIGADFLVAEPTVFWQDHAPGVRLMNEYGPTETVVGCSAYVLPNGIHRAGPVPVGGPIANLTFHVLDAAGRRVPPGLPGELYIGGAGVARGYLGRPALTAEKFVPDPFAGGGARMYRTGDRARWLAEGGLEILGRVDSQVKVRGYRVELGEVESVLRRHPAVRDCLAVVREDRPGDRRLVAYVVGSADADALREHLLASVPEYMVPSAFVALDALPQTATGKIDPRTLPAPEYGGGDAAAHDEPRDFIEVQLIQVWEETLGVELIGPNDNFFALGGSSLLALPLFARINRRLGCDLPVATLYAGATVRKMADAIRAQRAERPAAPSPIVPLQPHGELPPLFGVHPADRRVLAYVNLVRHLGPSQPVYGIQDVADDLSRPVEQIAAEHVRALRETQPRGPYYLAGWSFGGFVAFEMASLLERAGEEVAFLGMLDTMAPGLAQTRLTTSYLEIVVGVAKDVAAQVGRPIDLHRDDVRAASEAEQLERAVEILHAHGAAPRGFDADALREHCDVIRLRTASLTPFRPGPFSGRITLFRAEEVPADTAAFFAAKSDEERRTLGWCALTPRPVDVHVVPGAHVTMGAEPHVRTLARHVADALAAARALAETTR